MGYFYAPSDYLGWRHYVFRLSVSICPSVSRTMTVFSGDFIQICLCVMLSVNRRVVYVLYVPTVNQALLSGDLRSLWI